VTQHKSIRGRLGNRTGILVAAAVGFTVGSAGFVAAQRGAFDDNPSPEDVAEIETEAESESEGATPNTVDLTVPDVTVDLTVPDVTVDDSAPSTSTDDSVPDVTVDDSAPSTSIDDDDLLPLPDAFSDTYDALGGSISVTWTGTAFVLESISPADGYVAEIDHQSWDRIRVDFEGEFETRIEVRITDGMLRVRVD
jgi:hypothetical protein